ncbi:MAG: alpha-2-macroglobulin family protein [Mucilaginibacter sp.]|uniref:alpha-2-macroglobulin family protein n=1 Tax=Mucilaginibacter sp. TaxID=1882438 RepID=UPI0031A9F92E
MHLPFFNTLKYLLVICLFLLIQSVSAQNKYQDIGNRIDSLANIGLPKSALKEVDKLDALAHENNNTPQQIRAVIYRMTFQSYLEEDALVAIITRLKSDINQSSFPVKPVLQSLLAETYWKYYQQHRYQFSQRSSLAKADSDFTRWDLKTIIAETSNLYQLSLAESQKEQRTPISILDGVLEGDKSTRYLRPTLYDILVQRALDFYLTDEPDLIKPRLPFLLNAPALFGSSDTFAKLHFTTTDTASNHYLGIRYLQQATEFHLQRHEQEALADIDLQRLRFLYTKATVAHKDSLYFSTLQQVASNFSAKPISSDALVLQGQYYQQQDSLKTAHRYFTKAFTAYPESLGGKNARDLIKQIEEKQISASMESVNISEKPLLALLNYKNITSAKVSVYRLSAKQLKEFSEGFGSFYSDSVRGKYKLDFLKNLKPVQTNEIKLPYTDDYYRHITEIKIDGLLPGNYVLLVKDAKADDKALTGLNNFRVSRLAYVARANPDQHLEFRITDRETGTPLSGVRVKLSGSYFNGGPAVKAARIDTSASGTTNKEGLFTFNSALNGNISIALTAKGDTLIDDSKYINGATDNTRYDYPEDKTILFTDRQIYRPGQTIYFKGLQLQTSDGKSKIMPDKNVQITFSDVNRKQVSLLKLKTNEFGTFSGSFIIPQNMLGGNVELATEDGNIAVKVEEYKRPTFQTEFLPVKESYKLNDSVTIKGNVIAFSGYGLSQAKVAYRIERLQNKVYHFPNQWRGLNSPYFAPQSIEIKTDTIITDAQGHFSIKFKAIPEENRDITYNPYYTYAISADVTDASGETRSAQTSVIIGNNDIVISNAIPDLLFAKDSIKTLININNLNGQPQKATVKVELYALQSPDRLFKNRLWREKPDQFIINQDDFKKDFPDYAYQSENSFSTWKKVKQVINLNAISDEEKPTVIDLDALRKEATGIYQMIISARNEKGDTTSVTKYINLIAQPAMPTTFNNWVVPILNKIKPSEQAEFLVGADQKVNVLMERYDGAKFISSKWISIEKGQQRIKIPVSANEKDPVVQFMMVYQNRVYSSYQKIYRSTVEESLKIKLLSFRNKLQPGEKEQWKLQVSSQNNQKQAAEMLAGLYDASLDDITPAQNWEAMMTPQAKYEPNYFAWNSYDFINTVATQPILYRLNGYNLLTRDYEKLNLFDYNYYGGYNQGYQNYLEKVKANAITAQNDKRLEADYLKNAERVKNGYDVSGIVRDANSGRPIPGVSLAIKESNIVTSTNSKGYFRIKVPANASLVFVYVGYKGKQVLTSAGTTLNIKLEPDNSSLNEVVVVGYGNQTIREMTGAVTTVRIRGNDSIYGSRSMTANASGYLTGSLPGVAVQNADANQIFTSVDVRDIHIKPKPIIRKNFNETAFFYPQLRTDEKGQILIEFTIPEALTKWRFKALAHTKQLQTGYIENEVVTQKQLSISANMPRFLREGDTLTVSARLANLTAGQLKGKVNIQLFNALNMQPVSLLQNQADSTQQFEVAAAVNKAMSFKLIIPQGLDALTYRLTAEAGKYSDGEENTIPVLANQMLVTESLPMMVRSGQTRAFNFDKLLNNKSTSLKNKTLTLEYTQNPAWYAVQALPYMMEFPYECSEQLFSRYYANSLATNLVNQIPVIKQVFDQWKSSNSPELLSNLEKNQELKATLLEETPWLRDATNESEQKKRIALLFDLNKMSNELQLNLDKLHKRQLPNGGFPWFAGDWADRYITQYILAGIGQLYYLHIADDNNQTLKSIKDNALAYLDNQLIEDDQRAKKLTGYETQHIGSTEIHAWYARSYYVNKPMSQALKTIFNNFLKRAENQWISQSIYEQGMIALIMQRNERPLVAKAIIRSLTETAQQSDELGMYWGKNQSGYYWYQSPVETQSLMIELFSEAGNQDKAVEEMKIWLLRNKQTTNWKTTKATAAACYALLSKQSDWLQANVPAEITLNETPLKELKPDVKADAGTGYIKTSWADEQIKPNMGKLQIKNNGKSISWGAMYWQYLEQLDKITTSQTDIHLERKYFIVKQTDSGPVSTAIDALHQPKTGDLIKVIVYLKAGRDFEYVQLKDMRPAGTEPVDALSAYKYQDGLYYYQMTRDVATNFFISNLNKGNYVFEYQLRVAQPGNFSTGVATVQCMYAPEFNAHSEGVRITFKP